MILVTGGSGFIGTHTVEILTERGETVRVYDLKPYPENNLKPQPETVIGDILDRKLLSDSMKDCHTVYHLAANPHLWAKDPGIFDRVNRQGTENVIAACRENSIARLVFTGTESILIAASKHNKKSRITEEVVPRLEQMPGLYCRSKMLAEQAVFRAAAAGLYSVVVCPTLPIGPGDRDLTPPGKMISDFLEGKIFGYIKGSLNFVDVRDAALGHVLAAEKGYPGQRYILSGHTVSLKAFFNHLSRASGRPSPSISIPYSVALAWSYLEAGIGRAFSREPTSSVAGIKLCHNAPVFDSSRTRESLGYAPRPLEESISDAVAWYQGLS